MNKDSKIYVAGHTGLVGSALVDRLKAEGYANVVTRSRAELVEILNRRNKEGMSIIMSTHDLNLVGGFADRVYVLAKGLGVITEGAPAKILTEVDALQRSNIDPPILTELFSRLREQGIAVDIPISIDQAVRDLIKFYKT